MVMTVVERKEISDVPIHVRGSVHTLGEVVPRGFLQVISVNPPQPLPANQSGRRELAEWITDSKNPLTARVMVNRVWHWLMGEGLVRTVDNFGTTGEAPSHSELLDHLAFRFMSDGWSVKRLVRTIVLSDAYRRSSQESEVGMRIDPENRLLWRSNRKRLDAECLRDSMLLVAGRLDLASGGPTIRPGVAADFDYVDGSLRRSVYVPVLRNSLPQLFEVFDFPDPSSVVGRRNRSTVAPQALYMMNDPFVREQATAAARKLLSEQPGGDDRAIDFCFRQTLGRAPNRRGVRLGPPGTGNRQRQIGRAPLGRSLPDTFCLPRLPLLRLESSMDRFNSTSRRHFLRTTGCGFGALAWSALAGHRALADIGAMVGARASRPACQASDLPIHARRREPG